MKNRTIVSALSIIFVCLAMGFLTRLAPVHAEWNYTPPPKPATDIADAVLVVPRGVIDDHGMSDRTVVYYNIFKILEVVREQTKLIKAQGARIEVLEAAVKILQEPEVIVLRPGPCGNSKDEKCATPILRCLIHPSPDPNEE